MLLKMIALVAWLQHEQLLKLSHTARPPESAGGPSRVSGCKGPCTMTVLASQNSEWEPLLSNSEESRCQCCVPYAKASEAAPVLHSGSSPNKDRSHALHGATTSDRHDGVNACACAVRRGAAATKMRESVKIVCDCMFNIFSSHQNPNRTVTIEQVDLR